MALKQSGLLFLFSFVVGLTVSAAPLCSQLVSNTLKLDQKITQSFDRAVPAGFHFNSSVEVRGSLRTIKRDASGVVSFIAWAGPTELLESGRVIPGQDSDHHAGGFSSPIGRVRKGARYASLSEARSLADLARFGLTVNEPGTLRYESGVRVSGIFKGVLFSERGNPQVLVFEEATALLQNQILYDPSWGTYDILVGEYLLDIN